MAQSSQIISKTWACNEDDELRDLYPSSGLNIKQYYEYVDKYLPKTDEKNKSEEEDFDHLSFSEIVDTSAQIQLAAIVNQHKSRPVGLLPTSYDKLIKESDNVIHEEISNMIRECGLEDEKTNFKLNSKNTRKTYNIKETDDIQIVGLKDPIYLSDDFFDVDAKNNKKNIERAKTAASSPGTETDSASSNSSTMSWPALSPAVNLLNTDTSQTKESERKKMDGDADSDDEKCLARAKLRYTRPAIGVPEEKYYHNSTRTLDDYVALAINKKKSTKSDKKDSPADLEMVCTKAQEVKKSESPVMCKSNGITGQLQTKYYTPLELYNLKRKSKS